MLKSTHRPVAATSPLPAGWSQHKAPTGHSYYYNAETKQSTYIRPSAPAFLTQPSPNGVLQSEVTNPSGVLGLGPTRTGVELRQEESSTVHHHALSHINYTGDHGGISGPHNRRRPEPNDRPKSKHSIPGCAPWLLVETKLGRRFVYNPEADQSFWKFPPDVMKGVVEYDRLMRETRERKERADGEDPGELDRQALEQSKHPTGEPVAPTAEPMPIMRVANGIAHVDESDEYEEVEVTDDEGEGSVSKRPQTEAEGEERPLEFDEDDMAYQLTAMGQEYGLDPGEYGDGQGENWEEGAEGLPLTKDDSEALFKDMLNDFHIDPYVPWEKIIEEGKIIDDDRYICLPNMKSRKEVWGEWSRMRIQQLKEQRESQEKKDPRIPYLAFLQKHATPKLYWPEFRRKYRKEPEMRDTKISDKDREKWYRDYINRLKLPESLLKSDLTALLKSVPLELLNRSTSLNALPSILLTDIRYISLRAQTRDPLIEAYIAISPPAPDDYGATAQEEAEFAREKQERERREKALAERARQVKEEKLKQQSALRHSRDVLREGEEEIQRAMRISREGLLSHIDFEEQPRTHNSATISTLSD